MPLAQEPSLLSASLYPPTAIQGMSMRLSENGPGGTIRVLRWLAVVALLIPALLFAVAAWKDRLTILENAEDGGVKIAALFHEQAGNLFTGHEMILDMIVHRMQGHDWDTIRSLTDVLQELEVMDRRLDGASEILLVDAEGLVRATTAPVQSNDPLPAADHDCFLALSRNAQPSPHFSPAISMRYDNASGDSFHSGWRPAPSGWLAAE
jgi:hypothetical protein